MTSQFQEKYWHCEAAVNDAQAVPSSYLQGWVFLICRSGQEDIC